MKELTWTEWRNMYRGARHTIVIVRKDLRGVLKSLPPSVHSFYADYADYDENDGWIDAFRDDTVLVFLLERVYEGLKE